MESQKMTNIQAGADQPDIAVGQDVLRKEAHGLLNMAENLGETFIQALDLMHNTKGRVVVTGMGKSGHIGSKIAATLASTGTVSYFVHPGEASHGDLGMITEQDVVLAFSHSGETKELADVLAHCARFGIPIIAITGKENSTLGRAATVCLINGITEEACPVNLAPTSATTATLAMGDALAIALMTRRGFQSEDFANFHPGGKLGSKLSPVSAFMLTGEGLPLVATGTKMTDAIVEMTTKSQGTLAVVDSKNTLLGVITDGDLRRHIANNLLEKTVDEVMTSSPMTISANTLASKAVYMMQSKKITSLFVVSSENTVEGLIHIHHCLQAGVI